MNDRHTTTRSRHLGTELRRVRELAGYSIRDLARALAWSESKLSRIEAGERGASEVAVTTLLETTATRIREYDPLVAPGLLQTRATPERSFRATGRFPDDGIDLRIRVRMERQNGPFRLMEYPRSTTPSSTSRTRRTASSSKTPWFSASVDRSCTSSGTSP